MTSKKKNSIEALVDSILLQQEQCRSRNHDIDMNQVDEHDLHRRPSQRKPYTFLIQHTQSFMTRYNENYNTPNYYYRQQSQHQPQVPWKLQSGELWLDYLAHLILQQRSTHVEPSAKPAPVYSQTNVSENRFNRHHILFLSTLPITPTSMIQGLRTKYGSHRVPSISCGRLGSLIDFNDQQPQRPPSSSQCDLERLDTIVSAVKDRLSSSNLSTTTSAIFIDSITPILIRHGYLKLIQFLQQLMQVCSHNKNGKVLLVIPIRVEMYTSRQQSVLEQRIAFDAILNAEVIPLLHHEKIKVTNDEDGDVDPNGQKEPQFTALFIRRGVPSDRRDYVRRDTISYQVRTTIYHDDNDQIRRRYGIAICSAIAIPDRSNLPTLVEGDSMPLEEMAGQLSTLSLTSTTTKAAVPLQLDDGTRRFPPTTTTSTSNMTTKKPNIYLEENDPDYYDHDFDEDEPDDDLDL